MRPFGSSEELERRRLRAVALMEQGESTGLLSRILGVARSTLWRWRRVVQDGGSLKARPVSGRPPRLTDDDIRKLEQLLLQGPLAHGWPNELWTGDRVREVIRRTFGIEFHAAHVGRIL